MGFFSLKAICSVCNEKIGLNRFKISKSDAWACPKCLKKAGGVMSIDISNVTIEDLKQIILEKELEQENRNIAFINDPLSTSEGMYKYCIDNNFGYDWSEKWGVKHFRVIEDNLMDGEKIYMPFMGLHNYSSSENHENDFAYAITNKRIIAAHKNVTAGEKFLSISLENINDIRFESGIAFGTITIDTVRETFTIRLDKICAESINAKIHTVINEVRNIKNENSVSNSVASVADELKKFKELLDMGVLTQEEFDTKKKQLLNL